MSKTKGTTTERIVRIVQALQRFSCYATLAEIGAAIGDTRICTTIATLHCADQLLTA